MLLADDTDLIQIRSEVLVKVVHLDQIGLQWILNTTKKVHKAQTYGDKSWSFIFDTILKDKTKLPALSNLDQVSNKFNNNMMGCNFHKRTQLYLSGPTVSMGSTYTILSIHSFYTGLCPVIEVRLC